MKTVKDFNAFGIFIPKGSDVTDCPDSCAGFVRYDESKGCTFTPEAQYAKPRHGLPIAMLREYFEPAN